MALLANDPSSKIPFKRQILCKREIGNGICLARDNANTFFSDRSSTTRKPNRSALFFYQDRVAVKIVQEQPVGAVFYLIDETGYAGA